MDIDETMLPGVGIRYEFTTRHGDRMGLIAYRDGKVDLLASRGHGRGLLWYENPSWTVHEIDDTLLSPHCLQVADLDRDGDLDAATCAYESELAAWFENDGRGNFTKHIIANQQAAYDIRAIDMDGDNDLDLLIAGQASQNVVWLENPRQPPLPRIFF